MADTGTDNEGATKNAKPEERAPGESQCVTTDVVLHGEYGLIWGEDPETQNINIYYSRANKKQQAALCLSGGGIRSAAFALGVLQALSREKLLTSFHYLSTVSGGGYMGSWLQRWIYSQGGDATRVMDRLGAREVDPTPGPPDESDVKRVEPDEVKHLRENSNFITPRVGIGSNDTWTAVAISVRNIVINWLLFAPLIMLVALIPNLFAEAVEAIRPAAAWSILVRLLLLAAAGLCMISATIFTVRLLPSYRDDKEREAGKTRARAGTGDTQLRRRIVYPLLLWSLLSTLALSVELLAPMPSLIRLPYIAWETGIDLALFSLGGMILGLFIGQIRLEGEYLETFRQDWAIWPLAFVVTTAWVVLGAVLVDSLLPPGWRWSSVLLAVLGPLWMINATLIGAIVFAAFRKSEGPRVRPDGDREWMGRLSAIKIKPMLFWAVVASSVLLLNRIWGLDPGRDGDLTIPGLVALLSGTAAVGGGRSRSSGPTAQKVGGTLMKYLPLSVLIGLATMLFIVALLTLFGRLEYLLADWLSGQLPDWIGLGSRRPAAFWLDMRIVAHLLAAVVLGGMILLFGRKISVNRFSLNGFYRNRLARAFLGAARAKRNPDPFTGFDSRDNARMHQLIPRGPTGAVLYPVINVALNVTATENLAWQERKAMPFVFTPLFCGSGMLARHTAAPTRRTGAYVDSRDYAGKEPDFGMQERFEEALEEEKKKEQQQTNQNSQAAGGAVAAASAVASPEPKAVTEAEAAIEASSRGVSLSTAMAISGAAASPSMGYHSSPATAFLMTLFNVRLGAWLPNPALAGQKGMDVGRSHPTNSIRAMINELSGSTHDRGPDVYLSDGGHFENLALYEMIRRRCRYIVVSDAGADPHCTFEDLGNAVRKVKIDLDVDIEFTELRLSARGEDYEPQPQLAWALGKVTYPDKSETDGTHLDGWILYLKPSFFGRGLPVDVIAYARESNSFPHESTADQFFSESQFESYRRLADHFVEDLLDIAKAHPTSRSLPFSLAHLFDAIIAKADVDAIKFRAAVGEGKPA